LAETKPYPVLEARPIENEGVKLAVFAAGINMRAVVPQNLAR
jgi:hypothetical protein